VLKEVTTVERRGVIMLTNHLGTTDAPTLLLVPHITQGIVVRKVGDATVLDLTDSLTWDGSSERFRRKIWELLDAGAKDLIINLGGVSYLDSTGIGALLVAHNSIRGAGGTCRFFAAHNHVRQTLNRVHLDKVFKLFDDEAAAVSSC
jgi:anti-sigma B factor antagonist